jgi:F-type H+-transporting ATPase subunit b
VLIDWFTVVAQIVNFLILVALLKHFLYGRIIDAMDQREQKIAARMEEAEKKRREAEEEADSYRKKSQELDNRRDEAMKEARQEAEQHRKELTEKARHEVDQLRERWQHAVEQEKESFLRDLRQRVSDHVYTVVRRVLQDLAGTELEERVIDSFIERLPDVSDEERRKIGESASKADGTVELHSPFGVSTADRQKMTRAIRKFVEDEVDVKYLTTSDMILGIELRSHGHKVAWSVEEYLSSLESHIGQFLDEESQRKKSEQKRKDESRNEGEA